MNNCKLHLAAPAWFFLLVILTIAGCTGMQGNTTSRIYCVPLMSGEPTSTSIIIQGRLTASDTLIYGDIHHPDSLRRAMLQGKSGYGRFVIADNPSFRQPVKSAWQKAIPENDFIIRTNFQDLRPDSKYYYRAEFGEDSVRTRFMASQSFRTLPEPGDEVPVSFVMVTGSHLDRFYLGGGFGKPSSQGAEAYQSDDKYLGFPAFDVIKRLQPTFFVGNGDNVYYDQPPGLEARTLEEMRAKWQRQFFQPRFRKLFEEVPTVWLKDDHDHRFDDSDTIEVHQYFGADPSHQLGCDVFLEQVPLAGETGKGARTYRTLVAGKLLQLWLVEGRDFRSPNNMSDGPDKTLWGREQLAWLKQSLLESDAAFKILISPTPLVGPDDAHKKDNHVNPAGFRTEGDSFFAWLMENDFLNRNFYILCGDRHWKYHSVHATGFQEFSCGAMVDQNSRLGRKPGEPGSTDPQGLIRQPYTDQRPNGGFLHVGVHPAAGQNSSPEIRFTFYDQWGETLYQYIETL